MNGFYVFYSCLCRSRLISRDCECTTIAFAIVSVGDCYCCAAANRMQAKFPDNTGR